MDLLLATEYIDTANNGDKAQKTPNQTQTVQDLTPIPSEFLKYVDFSKILYNTTKYINGIFYVPLSKHKFIY